MGPSVILQDCVAATVSWIRPYRRYSVDALGVPEPIDSPAQLDVKRYGVIVSCGGRRGLLLPDLKGGISAREHYTLERFEVVRHT